MMDSVHWLPRRIPLSPVAVAATGTASIALAYKLLVGGDETLAQLRGVAGDQILLLTGDADKLPWVDGATYLGRDPNSPSLLVPTHSQPDTAAALFERALLARFSHLGAPLAVLPGESLVCSVCEARPVVRARLAAWLEEGR